MIAKKRYYNKIFVLITLTLLVVSILPALKQGAYAAEESAGAATSPGTGAAEDLPAIRTLAFDSEILITENNSYYVTERITIDFIEPASGFTRSIGLRNSTRMVIDGEEAFREFNPRVSGIEVEGGPFKAHRQDNNILGFQYIDVGDPDIMLEGRHDFVIRYVLNFELSPGGNAGGANVLENYDFVHLDLIPLSWPMEIDSANIRITFPKDADVSGADFTIRQPDGGFEDKEGMDVQFLWPDTDGRYTIIAQSLRPIRQGEALTFLVTLPKGYFVMERYFSPTELAFFIFAIAAPLLCIILRFLFGRSRRVVETVEFRPPGGLTPAEIGLLWNGKLEDRDLYSMFLYWSGKGAIGLEEAPDGDFLMRRKMEGLPPDSKPFEMIMFEKVFSSDEQVSMKASALRAGKAMLGARVGILKDFGKGKNALYEKRSLVLRRLAFAIAFLPVILNIIYSVSTAYWLFEASNFTPILFLLVLVFFLNLSRKGEVEKGRQAGTVHFKTMEDFLNALKSPGVAIFIAVICISVFVVVTSGVILLETPLHSIIAALSTAVCMIFAAMTRKRTEYYTGMLGQIKGFANFIRTAESDRIKLLVQENPNYFFDILPYAWAMGVTKEWEGKFNKFNLITMPSTVFVTKPQSVGHMDKTVPFTVRRGKNGLITFVIGFLACTGLFIQEVALLRRGLVEGGSMNNEFWFNLIVGFVIFLAVQLVGVYLLLLAVRWRIKVDGDMLTVYKPLGKKIQIPVCEISGVDFQNDNYTIMHGTRPLTKVKPGDLNLNLLWERLGI